MQTLPSVGRLVPVGLWAVIVRHEHAKLERAERA
jgi:hypothetical protein